jgi:hypothetical protein
VGRWQRYWFAEGGRTAIAVVRIALAVSILLTLAHLAAHESPISSRTYRPVGIWMLLGHTAPPAGLVAALWAIAWASTVCMLLGLATRASTAVSFVSAIALAALSFSASKTWSHQYNVVFIAHCAFLGARAGDTLSLDAWLRRRRGVPPADAVRGYQWSLRLIQLAVVLMFTGAAFHKLAHGHFTLRWALSDNLRHHLLVRYDLAGIPHPPFVDWLLAESWRYKGAALMNLVTQAAPLLGVIFVRRPLVRAFAGMLFVTEVILLGVVVGLWNLHWLPLVAVFVDWEALVARVRRRAPVGPASPPTTTWRAPRAVTAFIIAFLAYDIVTSFVPTLDQRLNTFPFSSFPMFATIRARPPYDQHLPYSVVSGSYDAISDQPLDPNAQRWLDHTQRNVFGVRDPVELEHRLRTVLERLQYFYPDYHIHGIRLWITVYEAPAYPGPARFDRKPIAVLGEITADGVFHTLLGKVTTGAESGFLELAPKNVDVPPDTTLVYFRDERAEPIAVPVPLTGNRFDLGYQSLPGNPRYFVAIANGVPWLVASHRVPHWE